MTAVQLTTFVPLYCCDNIDIDIFVNSVALGVDSDSNRNEYQKHFLGVKAAGA